MIASCRRGGGAVILRPEIVLADINAGLSTSWRFRRWGVRRDRGRLGPSNSKYAFLGATRSAAQNGV